MGKVDVTDGSNKAIGQRFGVKGFPTIKFFHGGKLFSYSGSRSQEALVAFARSGYASGEGEVVPQVIAASPEEPKKGAESSLEPTGSSDVVVLTSDNFEHLVYRYDADICICHQ